MAVTAFTALLCGSSIMLRWEPLPRARRAIGSARVFPQLTVRAGDCLHSKEWKCPSLTLYNACTRGQAFAGILPHPL